MNLYLRYETSDRRVHVICFEVHFEQVVTERRERARGSARAGAAFRR